NDTYTGDPPLVDKEQEQKFREKVFSHAVDTPEYAPTNLRLSVKRPGGYHRLHQTVPGWRAHESGVSPIEDLESDLMDIVVETPLPAFRSPDKPGTRTKVDVGSFDETFPEVWFRKLEVQLDAAGLTRSSARFSELLRFLDTRHTLAISSVLDGSEDDKYERAKKILLTLFLPDKPSRISNILCEKLGDGETLADLRARIGPRSADLTIDDFRKFILFREVSPNIATHLATSFDTLSLEDFQIAGDKLLAEERRRLAANNTIGAVGATKPAGRRNRREKNSSAKKQDGNAQERPRSG
ncbi:Hypothetical predicted protein, partial [Paramuricea clavata]